MRELLIERIRQLRLKHDGFSPNNLQWKYFYFSVSQFDYQRVHISDISAYTETLTDEELLELFEVIILGMVKL